VGVKAPRWSDALREAERTRRLRAAAVRLDSQPRLLSATRWLRQRIPGDERFGDPLSLAGEAPVQLLSRRVSALRGDRESLGHELALSAAQLWQALSERQGRGRGPQEVVLLFTDLVGFSGWALTAGDEAAVELLRGVGEVVESAITGHGGAIVKRLGDGLMAVFFHAQPAVEAALRAQRDLQALSVAGHRPQMRAGLHLGRPRTLGGDYLGVDVNVAARVGERARAGEVLISDTVRERLDSRRLAFVPQGPLAAPGVPEDLKVSLVRSSG
jgi:adenylate cyclase